MASQAGEELVCLSAHLVINKAPQKARLHNLATAIALIMLELFPSKLQGQRVI